MKRLLVLALALLLSAAAFGDERFSFTVAGIDCAGCAAPILKALRSVDGVRNPQLDWRKGVATVDLPAGFDKNKLRAALHDLGFEAVFPGEVRKELQPLAPEVLKALDIAELPGTKRVDAGKVVVPGKITVLDLYAEWCGPCKVLEARMQHYMQTNPDIALRRVDIGHWDNEAAKQATREFRAEGLPYLRVYDRSGKFVADVTGGSWDQVIAAIDKAR